MTGLFLQETEAAIVAFDLRGYSRLTAELSPLDLGLTMQHFYQFAEARILGSQGRLLKFLGDMVLGVWLESEVSEPRRRALECVARAAAEKAAWVADNQRHYGWPLDHSVAASAGTVLAGHLGTQRQKAFDVLGAAVNAAVKLTSVATVRGEDHLLTFELPGVATTEVEGLELGGQRLRLFRLAASAAGGAAR